MSEETRTARKKDPCAEEDAVAKRVARGLGEGDRDVLQVALALGEGDRDVLQVRAAGEGDRDVLQARSRGEGDRDVLQEEQEEDRVALELTAREGDRDVLQVAAAMAGGDIDVVELGSALSACGPRRHVLTEAREDERREPYADGEDELREVLDETYAEKRNHLKKMAVRFESKRSIAKAVVRFAEEDPRTLAAMVDLRVRNGDLLSDLVSLTKRNPPAILQALLIAKLGPRHTG